jgi:speckle-type POZ protein
MYPIDWILHQIPDFVMSRFAGVSVIAGSQHQAISAIFHSTNSGYHLLVVEDYAQTVREVTNGNGIRVRPFMLGGETWCIDYYPNGYDSSCAEFISLHLSLDEDDKDDEDIKSPVEAKYQFSFVDQVEYHKTMHIRATETYSFSSEDSHGCDKFIRRDALQRSTHLNHDILTIRCDIMVCKVPNTQDISGNISDIDQHLDCLLHNKVGSDVTFEVSGEMFDAHRCVLAARSTVFMAQLFGPMNEGATSSVIQIKDMEPRLFRALLSFIYTGSFPKMGKDNSMEEDKAEVVEEGQDHGAVEYILWLQELLAAADMYDLQRLKLLCEENLSEQIGVSSVASTLALSEQHHCHMLRKSCLKFIQVQSPKCLRKVMATDGWKHITTTYPSVLNELIVTLASNQKKHKKQ